VSTRVAITGLGVVSPIGNSVEQLFSSLYTGRSGIRVLPEPLSERSRPSIGAAVDLPAGDDHPRMRQLDRVSQLALAAASQAISDAAIDFATEDRDRCGVAVGSGMGGAGTTEEGYFTLYGQRSDRIAPFTVIRSMTNASAGWLAIEYGLCGPNLTYSTACSSSAVSIGEAASKVRAGSADVMLAGGCEAPLTPGVLRAWDAMRTLAKVDEHEPSASCRPFAATRSGLVLGEGAAFLLLESWEHALRRGARIHAELIGYGLTTDIEHITRPTITGQAKAMRAALQSAGRPPAAVDYINAHGTATAQNDMVETAAIREVFGDHAYRLAVSSTKSTHAHLLGAAGALEFMICVGCLERGWVPPTMHLNVRDPACDLDYIQDVPRCVNSLRVAMSNSFAFGGTNAVLIAERHADPE
jgi:3-oxoacyl-[acyl-carrier-protein] synthase II